VTIAEMEAEAEEAQEEVKRRRGRKASQLPLALMLLCLSGQAVEAFTAYDCSNRSNIVESYSLLERYRYKVANFIVATSQSCYGVKLATGQICYVQSCYFTKPLQTCYGQTCY
jgi:hypothetical protein